MKIKKILCLALAISLFGAQSVMAAPQAVHNMVDDGYILYISGTTDIGSGEYYKDTANLIVQKDSEIKGIDQTKIDADGRYEFKITMDDDPANCDISVRAGTQDVTSDIEEITVSNPEIEYTVTLTDQHGAATIGPDDTVNLDLKIVNKYKTGADTFNIYVASYDKDRRLISVDATEKKEVPYDINSSVTFKSRVQITNNTDRIKAFIWKGDTVIPVLVPPIERTIDSNIYVDNNGRSDGDGSKENPFNSIDKAVAELKTAEEYQNVPVSVILADGTYQISDTLSLSDINTGATVTFEAADDANVEITGFVPLTVSDYDGNIKTADVSGIDTEFKIWRIENFVAYPLILYCNGVKQSISRWPNDGWNVLEYGDAVNKGANAYDNGWNLSAAQTAVDNGTNVPQFSYQNSNANPSNWEHTDNIYVVGNLGTEYTLEWAKIGSVDKTAETINLSTYTKYGVVAEETGHRARWAVVNCRDEIDIPGEWAIDGNTLYWYPSTELTGNDDIKIAGTTKNLMEITNCNNLVFDNITFSGTRGNGIIINGSNNIKFQNCTVRDTGMKAFEISECTGVDVTGCGMYNTEGVYVHGCGDYYNLTSSNINITNNNLYSNPIDTISLILMEPAEPEIKNRCVGVTIKNNTLSGVSIGAGGIDTKIHNNEVSNTKRTQSDAGAIGFGRSMTQYDNEVFYNYIHDYGSLTNDVPISVNGVMLDDFHSGIKVIGNIIDANNKNGTVGVKTNSGSDNIIKDNIILNAYRPLTLADWSDYWWMQTTDDFYGRVVGKYLKDGYDEIFSQEPWKTAHPGISALKERVDREGKYNTSGNIVTGNLFYNCDEEIWKESETLGTVENNKTIISPSYDLTNIGSSISLGTVKDPTVLYPKNGQTGVSSAECTLVCQEDMLAEEYYFEVSTDRTFKTNTTRQTVFTPKFVFEDAQAGTTYYWRVTVRNRTILGKSEKTSNVFTFTTN